MTTIKHKNQTSNIKCYRQFKLSEHKEKIQCFVITVTDVIIIAIDAITTMILAETTTVIITIIVEVVTAQEIVVKTHLPIVVLVEFVEQL